MSQSNIKKYTMKVAVIGAGQMGNGIAHLFALNGHEVNLVDISQERLDQAVETIAKNLNRQLAKEKITEKDVQNSLNRIATFDSLDDAIPDRDLVVEAATERLDLKLQLFFDLDKLARKDCILASNTSSISITKIAAVTQRPQQVIGMHFMNPVPVMKLVEVIRGYETIDQVALTITNLSKSLGKIPVTVNDYPGFIANRILMPMINEAIYSVFQGVSGVSEIDTIMKLGMAHPMGPLELADFIGLDTCLSILRVLQNGFGEDKYAPCPLLVNMVEAGHLGVKSASGFYDYSSGKDQKKVSKQFN